MKIFTRLFVLCIFLCLRVNAQQFQQDFQSSTTLSSYFNVSPGANQFDLLGISVGANITAVISGGALRFNVLGPVGAAGFQRVTDLPNASNSGIVRFDLDVTGNNAATSAGIFQLGSGFAVQPSYFAQSNANVHSRFGINFGSSAGTWSLRDITGGTNTAQFTGRQTVHFVVNNSGASLTYNIPGAAQETVANDAWDLWVGTTRVFNDVAALTPSVSLSDFALSLNNALALGTVDIDDLLIDPIPPALTSLPATGLTTTSFTANWATTAGVTGYVVDVANDDQFLDKLPAYDNLYIAGASTGSLNVAGLTPGNNYYYQAKASVNYSVGSFQGQVSARQAVSLSVTPLTLLGFTGKVNEQGRTSLLWLTEEEVNVWQFEIEKSGDGKNFERVGIVPAKNTSGRNSYTFEDPTLLTSRTYYRVRMVDFDLSFKFTNLLVLSANPVTGFRIQQNPVGAQLLLLHARAQGTGEFGIYDMTGRKVAGQKLAAGTTQTSISVSLLGAGQYLVRLYVEGKEYRELFLKK